ncbi:hypothetical protein NP590_11060 [Methylomonas sp. SURF-2]|uniref:Uncharacterized protein n=1 Tax=Methylomonas subterranea TaxID=2952225 RepID=A0ABT1TGR6_9GAMM|nr:hypothetical protein [Methylomonas sp. SURF-2]MCQ8104646.1 hypothetical protein [Methylomonas sp. SURF-2]
MDSVFNLVGIAIVVTTSGLTAFIAKRKGLNVAGWFALGLFTQLLALVAILLLPSRIPTAEAPIIDDGRLIAFIGKVFAGLFAGFMLVFIAGGGAAGSSELNAPTWTVLIVYLVFFIPLVIRWARQIYKSRGSD